MTRRKSAHPGVAHPFALPPRFVERMRALLGGEADALFASLAAAPLVGLRVNTLKLGVADFQARVSWRLEAVPWCAAGFIGDGTASLGRHPDHAAGLYYLQEPAAMAVAEALAPQPGELVLDLAAAPGGKATHLAALAGDEALIVANEVERSRVNTLMGNLERLGVWNAVVVSDEPRRLVERWPGVFDRVLLDAPCSGEGMFRKSEAALSHWSEDNIRGCATRQRQIIASAADLVKPGGWLAYSTCTFAPEEDEAVIAAFLAARPDFEMRHMELAGVAPARRDWARNAPPGIDLADAVRIWPHLARGEGHFIALMQRVGGLAPRPRRATVKAADRRLVAVWRDFATLTFGLDPTAHRVLVAEGERLYAVPDTALASDGLRVARVGVALGTLRGALFEPSHSLALGMRQAAIDGAAALGHVLDLAGDDPRLDRYLQGHPIDAPGAPGWSLVAADGFPLGWGRRTGGTVKNAYPKGLRRPLS